jgi:hypothetical protein
MHIRALMARAGRTGKPRWANATPAPERVAVRAYPCNPSDGGHLTDDWAAFLAACTWNGRRLLLRIPECVVSAGRTPSWPFGMCQEGWDGGVPNDEALRDRVQWDSDKRRATLHAAITKWYQDRPVIQAHPSLAQVVRRDRVVPDVTPRFALRERCVLHHRCAFSGPYEPSSVTPTGMAIDPRK